MSNIRILAFAMASSSLVAVPAQAGGLLGGSGANCLCQAVNGVLGGGGPNSPTVSRPGGSDVGRLTRTVSRTSVSNSVNGTLGVATTRSIDRRSGKVNSNVGLAGTVSSATSATVGVRGLGKGIGLAGSSSTSASISKQVGLGITGLGTAHGKALAGKVAGAIRGSGRIASVSVLNKSGASGRSLANIAVLNRTGGASGKVANVSVLNRTGTTGRSLANVAILNGSGGTSGKVANVSVLNKTGTAGKSAINVAALNGSAGGNGRLANVAVLNGRHGNGHGALRLPKGVQIINGVPCGPDGAPLTGAAKVTVMAMINASSGKSHGPGGSSPGNSGNGSNGNGSSGSGTGGNSGGSGNGSTGGNGSPGTGNGGSQSGGGSTAGRSRDRDLADRKDLWWPSHTEGNYREGRLHDH